MLVIFDVVKLGAVIAAGPELSGITNGVTDKASKTFGSTVSAKCPCAPPPRPDCIDVALALSCELSS